MYNRMRFEWDANKDRGNQKKHGVSFEFATRVFADPCCMIWEDRVDEDGETRWQAVGLIETVILLVVHVYRSTIDGEEIIRIISARKASEHEGRRYFQ
jgi:uncharacterized DUF497 family protein